VKINTFLRPSLQEESGPVFNPNPAFLFGAKVEISPNSFTLGVKAEIEKHFSICLKY